MKLLVLAAILALSPPPRPGDGTPTADDASGETALANPVDQRAADAAARPEPQVQRDKVAGGAHWRLATERGAIHVWRPRGYRKATAGTVVYLHGYYSDVDGAWTDHALADQFKASGRNALFIVAESPQSDPDLVKWTDPAELFAVVHDLTGLSVPKRKLVVVGHSGAFRTIVPWLASPLPREIILLDGLYNNLPEFETWLNAEKKARRLILVGVDTAQRIELFLQAFPDAVVRDAVPERLAQFKRGERRARLLFLRSQYGHMELVTEGRTIPILLKSGALEPL